MDKHFYIAENAKKAKTLGTDKVMVERYVRF